MLEPRAGQRTKSRFVLGQVADNLRLGAGMGQNIEEIVNDHREIGIMYLVDILDQSFPGIRLDDLVEKQAVSLPLRLDLAAQEILFVLVFTAFFIVVQPQVGHDLVDRGRHQSGEDRIARVLCRRRQDATVKILLFNFEQTVQHRLDHPPLVVPEIVDQKKRSLRPPPGTLFCESGSATSPAYRRRASRTSPDNGF